MSFGQQRMWLIDQLTPGKSNYSLLAPLRFKGPLNADIMRRTLDEIVRRHESLRTTFDLEKGEPMQIISASLHLPLPLVDLTNIPAAEREAKGKEEMTRLGAIPFDLRRGPLCRAHLVRFTAQDHVLVWNMHHIVSDGWSYSVLTEEIGIIYSAFIQDAPNPLPELPIQYADFAQWQRQTMDDNRVATEVAFWRSQLAGAPESLELPTDHPRPASQDFVGRMRTVSLPLELTQRLAATAAANDATFFMAAFAGFYALLYKYSDQQDFVVGTPIANRTRVEVEKLIGFFVNTLAIRVKLDATTPFRDLLGNVRASLLESYNHQDLPFDRVVEDLHPTRDASRNPVFQALFQCHKAFIQLPQIPGMEVSHVHLDRRGAQLDLAMAMIEREGRWRASFEYATALWDDVTIDRMLGHFVNLLEAVVAQPDTPISRLPMLGAAERTQLLDTWNATERDYPRTRCLHELFEEQVSLRGATPALVFGDQTVSYAELNQQAEALAAVLRGLGVGPDVLVGLCVERSVDLLVGLYGILKAGGAYLPIDPAYPADRIAFVLEDSRAPVLVTQRPLLRTLPTSAAEIILLDEPLPAPAPAASLRPATPADLAYVLYTSGSTGQPKGVQIPHQAVVNFLHSMRREPGLTAQDTLLAVTTLSFDIAGLELHLPLTTGAKIILAPWDVAADGAALLQTITQHEVTLLQATPATWRLMLAAGWKGTPRLKALCGGEAMPADLAEQLIPRCAQLWNMYGPTETTIWSTCSLVTRADDLTIGRPIDNTQIYILDPNLQPLPIGLAGELLIGGDGLARGYHHRPDLTAERFIDHPFKPGQKLYRTGDLARWRPDGHLDCLGRLDFQVKIRGFRIELGEIETQLAAHPEIKQAIVSAREDTPGEKRLVAYVLAQPGTTPAAAALREHLRGRLPEYMVPAAFVTLGSFPLTPNGKIDRKALPLPDRSAAVEQRTYEAPQSETERQLAAIFAEVLRQPQVSRLDGFFDLGGHSLMVVQLQARIENAFGIRPELRHVFDAPTIAALAEHLEQLLGNQETGTI